MLLRQFCLSNNLPMQIRENTDFPHHRYQEAHHKIFDSHYELLKVFYGEFYKFY